MATNEEYAQLNAYAYGGKCPTLPPGWRPLPRPDGYPVQSWGAHGYYGAAFENQVTGEVVIVSLGTQLGDGGDRRSDLAMVRGQVPPQLAEAQFFVDLVEKGGIAPERITLTGHSLGGSISQLLSVTTELPSVTFNAFPVKQLVPLLGKDPNGQYSITDVVDEADIVSHMGPSIGTRVTLPASEFPLPGTLIGPFPGGAELAIPIRVALTAHSIDSIVAKLRGASALTCPLVLDLDGDGVETARVNAGAWFDHDGDGFAEQTGWVGTDDGLLVLDRNGNGRIDSGSELFGNHTPLDAGGEAANGYRALGQLDRNADGKVDAADPGFAALQVWKDSDGDGVSEPGELHSLGELGIRSISVAFTDSSEIDAQGNAHRQVGGFTRDSGAVGATADVWFQTDRVHTIADDWVSVPERIASLPVAAGYGRVRDLDQAMAGDAVLEGLVRDFSTQADPRQRGAILERILFRWTGSDGLDPSSRGSGIDARRLGVLEKFSGDSWTGVSGGNPNGPAAELLAVAYRDLAEMVYAQLMMASHLQDLYGLMSYSWDEASQSTRADLGDVAAELERRLAADPAGATVTLGEFARTLRGLQADTIFDCQGFHDRFASRGEDLAWAMDSAGRNLIVGGAAADTLTGTSDADAIRGGAGDDQLAGAAGADVLWGDAGADTLRGGAGPDILDGGAGNDWLDGGEGDDIYVFGRGSGQDTVSDTDWQRPSTDTIAVQGGVTPADVRVLRIDNDLVLRISGTGDEMRLSGWFLEGFGSDYQVQRVAFGDGTVWDVPALKLLVLRGTAGPDSLLGYKTADHIQGLEGDDALWGGGGDDRLEGGPGADMLSGDDGADTLDGGPGNDTLDGGFGNDTYVFGRGSGQDTIVDHDWQIPSTDRVLVAADVAPADMAVQRVDNDLVLKITGTADTARMTNWFLEGFGSDYSVQRVEFAEGAVWDLETLKRKVLQPTSGPDLLVGYGTADTISGLDGNDQLYGRGGSDTLDGGAGDDQLHGDAGNDLLRGGAGNDSLDGGDNDDTMDGGPGNDTLDGGFGNDTYVFGRGSGQDTIVDHDWQIPSTDRVLVAADVAPADMAVQRVDNDLVLKITGTADTARMTNWFLEGFGSDYSVQRVEFADGTLWDVPTLKQLVLARIGTSGPDTLIGTAAADVLRGLGGNDTLYGRDGADVLDGGTGADNLSGEGGDDTYLVDDPGDMVIEGAGQGIDTVQSTISYTLGPNVENLVLTGVAAVNGTGNALGNRLTGNGAANVLDGGTGADVLAGGGGDDTYVVDNAGDTVTEADGAGIDTVRSSITYTLPANVENLTLTGTAAINGTGNALDNVLTGNSAANVLAGGAGNDTYVVDNAHDVVTERAGEGTDTVRASIGYALGANVENLTLTGSAAINATGNALANRLEGNAGANVLTGGAGNDTYLFGRGSGRDTIVDNDSTPGNSDTLLLGAGIRPLDVVLSKKSNDLVVALHGSADSARVQGWYGGPSHQMEVIEAADGSRLLSTAVALLVQDMANYSASSGLGWDQAIDQRPEEVQAILAAHWLPAA